MGPLVAIWQASVASSWSYTVGAISAFAPRFIGALIVFLLGLIFAYWARRIVEEVLRAIRFDQAVQKLKIDAFLRKAEVGLKTREVIGVLVYWFVVFVFFTAAVDILAWTTILVVVDSIIFYTPRVFIAAFILAAGFLVARGVEIVIRGAVATVDTKTNRTIGALGRYVVVIFAFFAAISEVGIAEELVDAFGKGLIWIVTIASGLAFGLGAKDIVAKILGGWYDKLEK